MTLMCAGKVAIVTGASSGIGCSTALTLAREGASVVVNYYNNADAAKQVVAHITGQGGRALAVQADIFEVAGCQKLVTTTIEQFGRVDIGVINPGGGWHPEPPNALDAAAALDDIQHESAPVLYLLPLLLPCMAQQHWGRIIAVGMNPNLPSPAYAYNLAKAARREAILQAHPAAWAQGVTLNVVAPGPVDEIQSLEEAIAQSQQGEAWRNRATTSPQDIAESIAFLCSEAGRFITGAVLPLHFSG
ncbi:MAG TPA: SDR family oxidoreductase [Phototrophicaceae bacterium]|nr:SDR family oxidoreductase [Phototrophicaceae bacterium]